MSVIDEIATERRRQVTVEGFTASHDDMHRSGELAGAAACYATQSVLDGIGRVDLREMVKRTISDLWPWATYWWKPKNRRRDLIRAAALIVAEIERMDRAEDRE